MSEQAEKVTKKDQVYAILEAEGDVGSAELVARLGGNVGNIQRHRSAWLAARAQPKLETLRLDELNLDAGTQLRAKGINLEWRDSLRELRQSGIELDPIGVVRTTDGFGLVPWDGFHRIDGAFMDGLETIQALVEVGTVADARLKAAGANSRGCLARDDETKRGAVALVLDDPRCAAYTRVEVARAAGVSERLVYRVLEDRRVFAGLAAPAPPLNGHPRGAEKPARACQSAPDPAPREPGEDDDLGDEPARENQHVQVSPRPAPARHADEEAAEAYLATLPLYDQLPPPTGAVFARHALLYRALLPARKGLKDAMAHHWGKEEPGAARGGFPDAVRRFLQVQDPKHWQLCLNCSGKGCSDCGHRGFQVP